jgi:hypothetical protein
MLDHGDGECSVISPLYSSPSHLQFLQYMETARHHVEELDLCQQRKNIR